jgi:dihydropteroate synthase type 2
MPGLHIVGILNLSADSFSDGGRYDTLERAVTHGRALVASGAWGVDIGAVSSHPDSAGLAPEAELAALLPVIDALQADAIRIAVDTFASDVQRALAGRVAMLNDIRGFPDPAVWPVLADASCTLVVMHALQDGRADRRGSDPERIVDRIERFFDERLEQLVGAGISEERIVLDPGMGFFLGSDPRSSVAVLQAIPRLSSRFGRPVYISVSRKSFLGNLLGGRSVAARGPATLAAELHAVSAGAAWIRTHDVAALHDALTIQRALAAPVGGTSRPPGGSSPG